eukprot:scaffold472_cov264-Pinguiococcus_pyrenoidosus.AAC.14
MDDLADAITALPEPWITRAVEVIFASRAIAEVRTRFLVDFSTLDGSTMRRLRELLRRYNDSKRVRKRARTSDGVERTSATSRNASRRDIASESPGQRSELNGSAHRGSSNHTNSAAGSNGHGNPVRRHGESAIERARRKAAEAAAAAGEDEEDEEDYGDHGDHGDHGDDGEEEDDDDGDEKEEDDDDGDEKEEEAEDSHGVERGRAEERLKDPELNGTRSRDHYGMDAAASIGVGNAGRLLAMENGEEAQEMLADGMTPVEEGDASEYGVPMREANRKITIDTNGGQSEQDYDGRGVGTVALYDEEDA